MTEETNQIVQSSTDDSADTSELAEQSPTKSEQPADLLTCSTCHQKKPRTEFYKTTNSWDAGRGCTYSCKDCCRASARIALEKKKLKKEQEKKDATEVTPG